MLVGIIVKKMATCRYFPVFHRRYQTDKGTPSWRCLPAKYLYPGVDVHIKGVVMLVVSVRGVNFGFDHTWNVLRKTTSCALPYVAVKVLFRDLREEI